LEAKLRSAVESNEAAVRFGKSRPYPLLGVAHVAALTPLALLTDTALIAKTHVVIAEVNFFMSHILWHKGVRTVKKD
jgi:hypothetical protein